MLLITIGRKQDNKIVLSNPSISAYHAEIKVCDDGSIYLTDKSSTNGTFVNGKQISKEVEVTVKRSDNVKFAKVCDLDWNRIPVILPPEVGTDLYSIGCDINNRIQVVDPRGLISRFHATLKVSPKGKITINDHSSNGTYVNGVKIQPNVDVPVKRKDIVMFANSQKLDWNRIKNKKSFDNKLILIPAACLLFACLIFLAITQFSAKKDLNIYVNDALTKQAIQGVEILYDNKKIQTDNTGKVTVMKLPAKTYSFIFLKTGYVPDTNIVNIKDLHNPEVLSVLLTPVTFSKCSAVVMVKDSESGKSIKGASVSIADKNVYTDVDGKATFNELAANTYKVDVKSTEFAPNTGTISISSAQETSSTTIYLSSLQNKNLPSPNNPASTNTLVPSNKVQSPVPISDFPSIIEKYRKSVVLIAHIYTLKVRDMDGDVYQIYDENDDAFQSGVFGTGFFIDDRGTIATNRHVVAPWEYEDHIKKFKKKYEKDKDIDEVFAVTTFVGFVFDDVDISSISDFEQCAIVSEKPDNSNVDVGFLKTKNGRLPFSEINPIYIDKAVLDESAIKDGLETLIIGYPTGLDRIIGFDANETTNTYKIKLTSSIGMVNYKPDNYSFGVSNVIASGGSGSPIFDKSGRLLGIYSFGMRDTSLGLNGGILAKHIKNLYNKAR